MGADVESEYALRAWFKGAASRRAAGVPRAPRSCRRVEAAARDLQRLYALTQRYQERLARSE
jgi:hypothetical protein